MRREPNKKMVGMFMLVGIIILASIFGAFIKNRVFNKEGGFIVMYFEESIKGLNVGSPVVFKGVEIGKVAKIDLIAKPNSLDFSIPVYAKMARQGISSAGEYKNRQEVLDALIARGLRARLTSQSYVTGQLMIEFEMLPDTPIAMHNKNVDIMEIPTALSPMGELSKGLQELPIRQSVENFNLFFEGLNKEMPRISKIVTKIDKVVTDNSQGSADTINNLNKAIVNIGEAAKSFRNFSDYLERHPEALLKGKARY